MTELKSALEKITEGDFTVVLRKKREDEIGSLIDSYSKMTMQIENLMLEVRKEEQAKTEQKIKVLSMQIGPHFVYNTLNSIKWLAVINNQTNIKRMIESLIDLMMSVTYNTDEKIALQKEIELLESYCYIQKMRYSNFNLNIDASEELRQYKINKLILQPIVENSILYGFSKSKIHGNIWVKAYKTQNSLWVEVKDDGNGFESEKIIDIWEKEQTDNQHIGLKNVRERIRLSYGEPYDLFVESEIGEGTVVTLRLPLLNDSKESE